jgi:hypothetical protein
MTEGKKETKGIEERKKENPLDQSSNVGLHITLLSQVYSGSPGGLYH